MPIHWNIDAITAEFVSKFVGHWMKNKGMDIPATLGNEGRIIEFMTRSIPMYHNSAQERLELTKKVGELTMEIAKLKKRLTAPRENQAGTDTLEWLNGVMQVIEGHKVWGEPPFE